jgi:hypothetical protein
MNTKFLWTQLFCLHLEFKQNYNQNIVEIYLLLIKTREIITLSINQSLISI